MAKRRTVVPDTTADGVLFTRPATAWDRLAAPFMFDDAAALAAYETWIPGEGRALLRAAVNLSPMHPTVVRMKVEFLREVAAPRILWHANELAPDELDELSKRSPWNELRITFTANAPDWLTAPAPWLSRR